MTTGQMADDALTSTAAAPNLLVSSSSRTIVLLIALTTLATLIPVISVRFPPMTDYANHYVRLWLLTGGTDDPRVAAMYVVDWNVAWTNIAIDLIAVALGKITSMTVIGPVILALGLLLPPFGVALLNRRLFGSFHWWQLLCFVLAWNAVYLFGFINYSISLGLALAFAAMDDWLKPRGKTIVFPVRAIAATVLLVAHPFGLLFYAALLAALQFGPTLAPLRNVRLMAAAAGRIVVAILPLLVPLVGLLLFGPSLPGDKSVSLFASMHWENPSPVRSALLLLTYFRTYDFRIDFIYLMFGAILLGVSIWERTLAVHWGVVLAAIALGLIATVMPTNMLKTGGIDNRLPCMMVLAAAAGLSPQVKARSQAVLLTVIMLILFSRIAFIQYVWVQRSADVASVEAALAHVPAGSAVLPLQHEIKAANLLEAPEGRFVAWTYGSFWHYPNLAIMERQAFVPYLFTAAGKQPLRVQPKWKDMSVPEAAPLPVHRLYDPPADHVPYMRDWNARFDYLLVMNADMTNPGGPMPFVANLELVTDQGFAQLYRIDHGKRP